jgi:hypothetical protein
MPLSAKKARLIPRQSVREEVPQQGQTQGLSMGKTATEQDIPAPLGGVGDKNRGVCANGEEVREVKTNGAVAKPWVKPEHGPSTIAYGEG